MIGRTLAHVVLGTDLAALALARAHERAHVSQYERWGPFSLPACGTANLWAGVCGANPYRDTWFEREAFAAADPAKSGSGRPAKRAVTRRFL